MWSSTPSVSATRPSAGFSRSSPRSSAKWLRVPAERTMNGTSCSAATPATSACVPSPPATPSRSAPPATAVRASSATSTPGASSSATSAPSSRALRTRSNLPTLPPPDFGFMIRNGWRGGGVEYSVGAWSATSSSNAAREAAADAAHRAASTTTTQSRPARTKPTSMRTGAATRSTPARTRATPRWVRNHQAPTRTAATAATATSTRPRLPRMPCGRQRQHDRPDRQRSSASRESHRDRPLARPTAVSDVAGTVRSSVMRPPSQCRGAEVARAPVVAGRRHDGARLALEDHRCVLQARRSRPCRP